MALQEEVRRLQEEVRRLSMENEAFKKAQAREKELGDEEAAVVAANAAEDSQDTDVEEYLRRTPSRSSSEHCATPIGGPRPVGKRRMGCGKGREL